MSSPNAPSDTLLTAGFSGKTVIVTGGAGGLGKAYVRAYLRAGANVVVNDRGTDLSGEGSDASIVASLEATLLGEFGETVRSRMLFDTSDVGTAEGAAELLKKTETAFGVPHALVTSAGALRDKPFLKMGPDDLEAVLHATFRTTFHATQAFARLVVPTKKPARIVNTLSMSAFSGSLAQSNFSAANAAILGLMRTASIELQKHRITVNAVAPLAKTRMTETLPMFHSVDTLTPEHVVPAVFYLSSDLVGDRTGYVLGVAGSRMYSLRTVESHGRFKEEAGGLLTPEEIQDHWSSIVK